MNILDLGAHDGFISAYVADQIGDEFAVRIDGIELNSHGVEEFNRRMLDRGGIGVCKRGAAEDAPTLFEPGSYDAVIAYELIEHVPDVDLFLDACEQMCAPGGRIYLSTPDGTFGAGQNPHHLRAMRTLDFVEIIRRRGDMQDVHLGADTITVASYVPWAACDPPLKHGAGEVAIYCGPGWKKWSPLDMLAPGGLGGSETAASRLAESLQKLGYDVTVYGEVDGGAYGQAVFRHWSTFDPTVERHAVISSRIPGLVDRPINAGSVLLWLHDTDAGPELTPERADKFDRILCLGEWHAKHLLSTYPFLLDAGKLEQVPNGIEPSFFLGADPPRTPEQVLVTSSPDRGLDIVLEAWPLVLAEIPEAQLGYCYADVYDAVAKQRPEVAAWREKLNVLSDQPGVTNLGALAQPDVAQAMRAAGVWVHPSFHSASGKPFSETFCIGALEAAAAGCHLVVAGHGALRERVCQAESWTIVHDQGEPVRDPARWADEIISAIKIAREGIPASALALEQSWDRAAGLIAGTFAPAYAHGGIVTGWVPSWP